MRIPSTGGNWLHATDYQYALQWSLLSKPITVWDQTKRNIKNTREIHWVISFTLEEEIFTKTRTVNDKKESTWLTALVKNTSLTWNYIEIVLHFLSFINLCRFIKTIRYPLNPHWDTFLWAQLMAIIDVPLDIKLLMEPGTIPRYSPKNPPFSFITSLIRATTGRSLQIKHT